MVGRQTLVDEWRMRLAEWRERLAGGSRRPWLAKLYIRLYTYLVQRYGDSDADSPLPTLPADEESSMPFFVADPIEGGRPPRSAERIRPVLDAVHESNPGHDEAGPLADGLAPDSMIAVAAFYDRREVARLQRMLKKEGIESETRPLRKQTQVIIRLADLRRSRPIVDSHAFTSRDSSARRRTRVSRWAVFGGLIGFLAGFVAVGWRDIGTGAAIGMLTAIIGVALGLVLYTINDG